MTPYVRDVRQPGGGYALGGLHRPNRLAAGMAATLERTKRIKNLSTVAASNEANRLSVRGTLDVLAMWRFDLVRVPCPCCGGKSAKVRLKPGAAEVRRRRLKFKRQDRLARQT